MILVSVKFSMVVLFFFFLNFKLIVLLFGVCRMFWYVLCLFSGFFKVMEILLLVKCLKLVSFFNGWLSFGDEILSCL